VTERSDEPVWLPGFFTGRLHAVADGADHMVFHGTPIVWSVCGRAATLEPGERPPLAPCDRCVLLAGPPSFPDRHRW
jgi:hypothetical protein